MRLILVKKLNEIVSLFTSPPVEQLKKQQVLNQISNRQALQKEILLSILFAKKYD